MTHDEQLLIIALAKAVAHLTDAVADLAEDHKGSKASKIQNELVLASGQLGAVADLMAKEWTADVKP